MLKLNADEHQPWTLTLRAKSPNFNLRLKVSKIVPLCSFSRSSIWFKLNPYMLKIKCKPKSSFSVNPTYLKHKLLTILKKFRFRRAKDKVSTGRNWRAPQKCSCGGRKIYVWKWILLSATAIFLVILIMHMSSNSVKGFQWKRFWKVLKCASHFGPLYQIAKVVFNADSVEIIT